MLLVKKYERLKKFSQLKEKPSVPVASNQKIDFLHFGSGAKSLRMYKTTNEKEASLVDFHLPKKGKTKYMLPQEEAKIKG